MSKEELITVDDFWELWKIAAKRASDSADINKMNWLLMVQNFTEWFYLKHLNLNLDEIKEFGYHNTMKEVLSHIKTGDVIESLVYTGANLAFNLQEALRIDAYNFALDLYKKYCEDIEVIKKLVIQKYDRKAELYSQAILDSVPDELVARRMMAIEKSYSRLPADERKYINKALTTELDESMVFDIKDLHKTHLAEMKEQGDTN